MYTPFIIPANAWLRKGGKRDCPEPVKWIYPAFSQIFRKPCHTAGTMGINSVVGRFCMNPCAYFRLLFTHPILYKNTFYFFLNFFK